MQESDPNRPVEPNNRLGRISKNAAFLMMMAVMLLFVIRSMSGPDQAVLDLTYTEFNDHLNADRVDQVTFRDRAVTGEFRQPVREEGEDFDRFRSRLPGEVGDQLLEDLIARGVVVSAEATERGLGTVLLGLLPWLLFIAFWICCEKIIKYGR